MGSSPTPGTDPDAVALAAEAEAFADDLYGRVPGSDAERRAAQRLAGRLRALGREASVEPFAAWPNWPVAYTLHALAAIGGSVLSVRAPAPGAALVVAATLLTLLDAAGLVPTTRRLLGRRSSQNVVSWGEAEAPGVLILAAHYDVGRAGRPGGRLRILFWAMCAVLLCCLIRLTGVEGTLLTAVQFVPTVALVIAVPLLVEVALSPPATGQNDNASGVVVALRLAERFAGRLEHFEVHLLLSGSQWALAQGARAFFRRHRGLLDPARVVVLNLDALGAGGARYTRREGAIVTFASHRQLTSLCSEIAEDDEQDGEPARPFTNRSASDGYAARSAGFPAITIGCRDERDRAPETIDPDALARAEWFCAELIRRVDAELGPEVTRVSSSRR